MNRSLLQRKSWRMIGWIGLAALLLLPGVSGRAASPQTAALRVVASDATHVVLELVSPEVATRLVTVQGTTYTDVTLPGLPASGADGAPDLPIASTLIGVPPGAQVTLQVLDDDPITATLAAPVLPVPTARAAINPLDPRPPLPSAVVVLDPDLYAMDGLYPSRVAEVSPPGKWRSQTVVRVRLNPVQTNPARRELVVHRRLLVELRFVPTATVTAAAQPAASDEGVDEGAFEGIFQVALANYASARSWRAQPEPRSPAAVSAAVQGPLDGAPWFRVALAQTGIYRLTCADLAEAGIDLSTLDLNTLRLYQDGMGLTEVALNVKDANSDARCDAAGDAVEFYGQRTDAKYTSENIYWLTYGGAPGKRMALQAGAVGGATVGAYAHTVHLEENKLYFSYIPLQEDANHWYWEILSIYTGAAKIYTFTVDHLAADAGEAHLVVDMAGFDGTHRTQVSVNNHPIDDALWSGRLARRATLTFPATYLVEGINTLQVAETGGAADIAYTNFFEVRYPRMLQAIDDTLWFDQPEAGTWHYVIGGFADPAVDVYDITDPTHVERIAVSVTAPPCPCTASFDANGAGPRRYLAQAPAQRLAPIRIEQDVASDLRTSLARRGLHYSHAGCLSGPRAAIGGPPGGAGSARASDRRPGRLRRVQRRSGGRPGAARFSGLRLLQLAPPGAELRPACGRRLL